MARRGLLVVLVALAACGPAAPPPASPAPPARAFVRVELAVSNLEVGPPDRLMIDLDGAMRLVRVAGQAPAGIGFFETRLRPDELRALARSLQDIESLPDHWGRLVPDSRVRRVKVTWAGAPAVEKAVGESEPIDPRLAAIVDRLEALMARAGEHPRQAFTLELAGVTPGPEGALVLSALVRATGTSPIQTPALGALVGDEGALAVRLDGASGAAELHVTRVEGPEGPRVRLEPGGVARYEVHAVLPSSPPYEHVSLVLRWDGAGAEVPIAGELRTPSLPLVR